MRPYRSTTVIKKAKAKGSVGGKPVAGVMKRKVNTAAGKALASMRSSGRR